jgi:ABC-type sugar transport system ATPase subunit
MSTPTLPVDNVDRSDIAIAGLHIAKRFGHVNALIDASVTVRRGEVVALFGDNGAGKSTFVKTLVGINKPDAGEIIMDGKRVDEHLDSVRTARNNGIEVVYQDLALAHDLSVVDNMYMGHEVKQRGIGGALGFLNRKDMAEKTDQVLRELSIKLPSVYVTVGELSGGQRQAVAVARAVMWARTAVLMDEPTAALGARQSEIVGELIRTVAARGLGVLMISHDIPRALITADRVSILWRGHTALEAPSDGLTVPDVVSTMVGFKKDAAA